MRRPGNEAEDVGGTAAPGGERAPVTAKAKRGATQKTARVAATATAKPATKRRATSRAVRVSGIDLPDFLGAVTGDMPTIDETQRRFFHAAFIDCIRAALMKCAT